MPPTFKTFSSLRHPSFRLYLSAYLCQMVVMDMRIMAQYLLIYRLTGSVTILGVMALVNALPGILMPLVGGVIADRIPKKYVLILTQAGTLVPSLVVALSLTLGFLSAERDGSWLILLAASFINYSIAGLAMPSRQAIIAELVGEDHIMNAISLRSMGYNIMHMGAPALAGVLIDALGFEYIYYIMGSLSLISLILTLFLPLTGTMAAKSGGVFSQMKDGLKYVRGETKILFILGFTMLVAMLAVPYIRLMPIFVDDILKVGATGMGILLSASAVGALAASLVMASLPSKRRGIMLLTGVTVLGVALVGFAISRNWYVSLAVIVFIGMGQTVRMTLSNTLLQSYTVPDYRGRVMSLYAMQEGITSLGAFIAAMLAGVIGVSWVVGSFASAIVILSLFALVFLPQIRKLD